MGDKIYISQCRGNDSSTKKPTRLEPTYSIMQVVHKTVWVITIIMSMLWTPGSNSLAVLLSVRKSLRAGGENPLYALFSVGFPISGTLSDALPEPMRGVKREHDDTCSNQTQVAAGRNAPAFNLAIRTTTVRPCRGPANPLEGRS